MPAPVRYRLRQSFRYDYDAPALSLLHRLVVVPPRRHGDQVLRFGGVQVSDPAAQVDWETDGHGNRVCVVRCAVVPSWLELQVAVVVERAGDAGTVPVELLTDPRLTEPSWLTAASPAVRRLADTCAGDDPLAAADRLCRAVRGLVRYVPGSTGVRTTGAQALAGGQGVCQDQAHVLLAACRAAGIACRYVSGHMVGQGGTHAWVEVVVPDGAAARAVAFDPCHGCRADRRYVTVAVGRDYLDVPPTSGWYSGPARGRLSGTRELVEQPVAA
ncbi:MAG TPA: transglutaminase family protein [Mycobacteriales bacterium]|nr:transglutaminase family protein [Mycobacteriales bacterium]